MTKEEIQRRYKELVLPESKKPYHFEKMDTKNVIKAYNPMCGDKYQLYIDEEKDAVKEAYFHGIGCAVSKASTSLLMQLIEGKNKEEVAQLCSQFIAAIEDDAELKNFSEALNILAKLRNFDGRVDCILLSWKALLKQLK